MGLILSHVSGGKMNSKDLKRMTRAELLEVLLTQSRRIRELAEELEETKAKLEDRGNTHRQSGKSCRGSPRTFGCL